MNKAELVQAVMDRQPNDFKSMAGAERIISATLDVMSEAIVTEGSLKLQGFGSFDTYVRSERPSVNPSTKEKITVPATKVVRFHPAERLKDRVAATK